MRSRYLRVERMGSSDRTEGSAGRIQVVKNDVVVCLAFTQLRRNPGAKAAVPAVDAVAKSGFEKRKCAVNAHRDSGYQLICGD